MNRRTLHHLLLALTALAATACTADSDTTTTDGAADVPITFGLATAPTTGEVSLPADDATRANAEYLVTGTTFATSRQVGLFGHVDGAAAPGDWLFYNEALTVSDAEGHLSYAPLRYWPNTAGERVSFYAYYPHSDTTDSGATSWSHGVLVDDAKITASAPVVSFRQAETAAEHVDFMYATAIKNQTKQSKADRLTLTFNHALAKVTIGSITVTGSGTPTQYYLKNAIMSGQFDLATGAWTGADQRRGYVRNLAVGDVLLMLPQSAAAVKLVVIYENGGTSHIKETALTGTWQANGQYNLNVSVTL